MKKMLFYFVFLLTIACTALASDKVDLDLSRLSGTVVYSQVYNMMVDPTPYLGKTIRIAGYYDVYEDTATGNIYHTCIIPDATACCAQGMEFVWAGEHTYPGDYKSPGTDLTVTGMLELYEEEKSWYLHLIDAEVEWGEEID